MFDTARALALFGDWTDRVAKGELPKTDPPRPHGIERNIVVTEWDWNTPKAYLHDEISTDKRNPTRQRERPDLWLAGSRARICFPGSIRSTTRPGCIKTGISRSEDADHQDDASNLAPSPYWGTEPIWDSHTNIHNPMFDEKGRLWLTARIRPAANPAFCKAGSNHPSAKVYPKDTSNRQTEVYDPKTREDHA